MFGLSDLHNHKHSTMQARKRLTANDVREYLAEHFPQFHDGNFGSDGVHYSFSRFADYLRDECFAKADNASIQAIADYINLLLVDGSDEVRNAVYVSFIEGLVAYSYNRYPQELKEFVWQMPEKVRTFISGFFIEEVLLVLDLKKIPLGEMLTETNTKTLRFAVFADIHGKVLLPFLMVREFAEEYGETIDAILQCGDVGAFPDPEKFDKATLKHAKHNRDELGFFDDFTKRYDHTEAVLRRLGVDMYCVRGNHEDHDFLDELEQQLGEDAWAFPIDCYKHVFMLKSGVVMPFRYFGTTLNVLGIGRIGDRKNRTEARFIQDYERERIAETIRQKPHIHVLLTHDTADDMTEQGYGMKELRTVLDELIPEVHFFGHTGKPYTARLDNNELTQSVKIKELEFDAEGALPEGCMVILTFETDGKLSFEAVPKEFTDKFTQSNWQRFFFK
ncbi:MAG: metallophosphoesterase [Candidatus Kapabacteria bacterium]|jgi:Icc-related predicted phosphoesterase|nr:metallophosphoesterase [Candidatus Kapabacteria bacterium]